MQSQKQPTEFRAKTWIYWTQAILLGFMSTFSLIMGPLFLLGGMDRADGKPGTEAGVTILVMGLVFVVVFLVAVYNIRARSRPILRIRREGIEIRLIGSTSLDRIPLAPRLIRLAWGIVSLQGVKHKIIRAPWEHVRGAVVSGPPMAHRLSILALFFPPAGEGQETARPIGEQMIFHEAEFKAPVAQIASAVNGYSENPGWRDPLRSWDE